MGRQIYPELDFWGIAEPYLDNWLKEQFSPLKLKEFIVENKEDLLMKASEMPSFIYEALDELRVYSKNRKSYDEKINNMQMQFQREKYIIRAIGIGIIVLWGIFVILS
jgi:ubiquinone biosynthesis protein